MGIYEMREDRKKRGEPFYTEQEVLDLVDEARKARRVSEADAAAGAGTKREAAQTPNGDDSEWTFMGKDMKWSKFWQMRHELRQRNGRYFTEREILELVAEAKRDSYGK